MYKKNAEQLFGHVKNDLNCTKFDPLMIDKHMNAMFLDYKSNAKRALPSNKREDSEIPEKKPKLLNGDQTALNNLNSLNSQNIPNDQTLIQVCVKPQECKGSLQVSGITAQDVDVDVKKPVLKKTTKNYDSKSLDHIIKTHNIFIEDLEKSEDKKWQQIITGLTNLESSVSELNDVCKAKDEEILELKMVKESQALLMVNYRTKIKNLEHQFQAKCIEQAKEVAKTKHTMNILENNHADEIASLMKTHKEEISDKTKKFKNLQENYDAKFKRIKQKYNDVMKELKRNLRADREKDLSKLKRQSKNNKKLNDAEIDKKICKLETEAEKPCVLAKIESPKLEHSIETVEVEPMKKEIIEEKDDIETQLELMHTDVIDGLHVD